MGALVLTRARHEDEDGDAVEQEAHADREEVEADGLSFYTRRMKSRKDS
jgi:hypothetical protein